MPDDVLIQFINREEVAPTLFTRDGEGYLPFHYALRVLRPEVCELLLAKGANLLEPDPKGLTALHYIADQWGETKRGVRAGYLDLELPKDYFDRCLSLWRRYLNEGGSINEADNAGYTPLHTYLLSDDRVVGFDNPTKCHLDHFEKFFPPDSGVDVFAVNHEGETALHLITRREKGHYSTPIDHDKALFELMMAKGLDPLKEDARGRSALDVASACEKDSIMAILGRK
jgi:ankyrin repeat protein